jgi:hypothetical protein
LSFLHLALGEFELLELRMLTLFKFHIKVLLTKRKPNSPPSWAMDPYNLPGAHRRCFYVGGGRSRTFSSSTCHQRFHIGGERFRTFSSGTSWGPVIDIFTLVVGAPGPSALIPAIDVFMLVVGALRLLVSAPSEVPSSTFSC